MSKRIIKTCSIEGCLSPVRVISRGWCNKHYQRWSNHGDPNVVLLDRAENLEDSFKKRTERQGDCTVWAGTKCPKGYGMVHTAGTKVQVHRFVWEQKKGPIPDGYQIDHICHNKACFKIDHLRLATNQENSYNRKGAYSNSRSGVRNVSPQGNKWAVTISKNKTLHYFGAYSTIEEAAEVAAQKRKEMFGEFAGKG